MISVEKFKQDLNLTCLVPCKRKELNIKSPDLNRPGMQFCGFYDYFAWERPQLIGIVEMAYLERQDSETRSSMLSRYFSYDLPCVVICRNLTPPPELLNLAREADIPVFRTSGPAQAGPFFSVRRRPDACAERRHRLS